MRYESPITQHSKAMANVQVFGYKQMEKDKWTDGRTNRQAKNYMPLIYRCIKKDDIITIYKNKNTPIFNSYYLEVRVKESSLFSFIFLKQYAFHTQRVVTSITLMVSYLCTVTG